MRNSVINNAESPLLPKTQPAGYWLARRGSARRGPLLILVFTWMSPAVPNLHCKSSPKTWRHETSARWRWWMTISLPKPVRSLKRFFGKSLRTWSRWQFWVMHSSNSVNLQRPLTSPSTSLIFDRTWLPTIVHPISVGSKGTAKAPNFLLDLLCRLGKINGIQSRRPGHSSNPVNRR